MEEIAEAKRMADAKEELPEETALKAANKEWEDLMKRKEEQDEKLLNHNAERTKLTRQRQEA